MRTVLISLLAAASFVMLLGGCAAVRTTGQPSSQAPVEIAEKFKRDPGTLTEREKWSLAREAYSQAQRAQSRKLNEAAAYYYEITLALIGSLDMAFVDIPTGNVLAFQRKVLNSYDKFIASVDRLPATAGPMAVIEASTDELTAHDRLGSTADDRDAKPAKITPNAPQLPPVPMASNSLVAGQINFFMNKGRRVMETWMQRSRTMFPRLREILEEEGVPEEVLFLAMVESGLNPKAYSYAHAAGVWQFIPSTGRIYGLTINSLYDERMHVERSTRAACRYLRKLHDQFGDWFLAFAAYNCGEMRVEREIKRSGTRDYFKLHKLPRETRGYVPAYLAARAICENPTQYGFTPRGPEIPFDCEWVSVEGSYRLDQLAEAAGMDPELVKQLNPEFIRGVTAAGGTAQVRMPRKPYADFMTKLAALPETVVKPTQTHVIRKGETLGAIASRYGTSVSAITRQPENRGLKPNRLRVGQRVVIPVPGSASTQTAKKRSPASDAPSTAVVSTPRMDRDNEIVYTVHRGETLGKIGRQLGVSVAEICRQNGISRPDDITPGQKLRIRVSEPVALNGGKTHTVQRGDTLWSIAQQYGKDLDDILSWNQLNRRGKIYPGQKLIVSQQ